MILLMTTARITMNLILPVTAQILQTAAILLAVIRSLILLRIPVMAPEILPEGMLPEGILLEEMLLRFRITQRLPAMAMSQVKITTGIM